MAIDITVGVLVEELDKFTAGELKKLNKLVTAMTIKKLIEESIKETISGAISEDEEKKAAATDQAATDQAATDEIDDPSVEDVRIFDKYMLGDSVRFDSKLYNTEMIGTVIGQAGTKVRVQTCIDGRNTVLRIPQKQIINEE